jgi:hypothetical protein
MNTKVTFPFFSYYNLASCRLIRNTALLLFLSGEVSRCARKVESDWLTGLIRALVY